MTPTPTLPTFLALAAGGTLGLLVGVAAGRRHARHQADRGYVHLLHRFADLTDQLEEITEQRDWLRVQLTQAEDAIAVLGPSLRRAWQKVAELSSSAPADPDPWPLSRLPGGEWVEIPPQHGQRLWGNS